MQQSRHEFLTTFLDYVGHADDSGAYHTAERILMGALQTIWSKRAWRAFLHPTPYQLTLTPGTRTYALPDYFGRISGTDGRIRNLTVGSDLFPTTVEDLQMRIPAAGSALDTLRERPQAYVLAGTMPVHTQPSAAGDALEVLSDAAADSTVRAVISGVKSTGQWTTEQFTLNGVTPVAVGTWTEIHEFGKGYPSGVAVPTEFTSSAGTVTLRKVSGATDLQVLLAHESAREVQAITFDPAPDQAYVIAIPFIRQASKSFKDAQPIPADWGPALFEECDIEWQVNAGELSRAEAMRLPRPKLVDLVCLENAAAAQQHRHRRPFQG